MFGIQGGELIVLLVVALLVIGPERLPEYTAKLGKLVRQLRGMADSAKGQLRDQMGPDFDDVDWKQYDPRQYDPRRIVREALLDSGPDDNESASTGYKAPSTADLKAQASSVSRSHDPDKPTPYDTDAT